MTNLPHEMDVPAELDRRILAAASCRARSRRLRPVRWSFAAAAAAALLVSGAIFFQSGNSGAPAGRDELVALADWSSVSQESYLLAADLNLAPGWEDLGDVDYNANDWSIWI